MAVLSGVQMGPLDPDRGENMGQIGGGQTARKLIRQHAAMNPPALRAALSRGRHELRTGAIVASEAAAVVRASFEDAGEALPKDADVGGFVVRGDDEQSELQVLTFIFSTKSGRTGKGFVPYSSDGLDKTRADGDEVVRIAERKKAGLPWGESVVAAPAAPAGGQDNSALIEQLIEQNNLLKEALAKAAESSEPEAEEAQGGAVETPAEPAEPSEPWDGFDSMKAPEIVARLRESKDSDLAAKVLAYEQRSNQSRSSVISAANEVMDRSPGA